MVGVIEASEQGCPLLTPRSRTATLSGAGKVFASSREGAHMSDDAVVLAPAVAGAGRGVAKAERNRRALEEHALRLFRERGYDAVTVAEIADAAFLSTRTFFRYFGTKEDVVFEREREYIAQLRAAVLERPPDEPARVALAQGVICFARIIDAERDVFLPRMQLVRHNEELLGDALRLIRDAELAAGDALAERQGRDADLEMRSLAAAFVGVLAAAAASWVDSGGQTSVACLVTDGLRKLGYEWVGEEDDTYRDRDSVRLRDRQGERGRSG